MPHVTDVAAALEVAVKAQQALVESIDAGDVTVDVDVSIGIAMSAEHGCDVASLMKHADIAMYRATRNARGIDVYDADRDDNSPERLGFRRELGHHGLSVARRAAPSARTRRADPPLPAQDRADDRCVQRCRGSRAPGAPDTGNDSPGVLPPGRRAHRDDPAAGNLLDAHFPDHVEALLAKWELAPTCLMFEVTESAVIVEPDRAEAMQFRLANMGIELAIDDFGAGYTSLAHLRTLPVLEHKIDQSLVPRWPSRPGTQPSFEA